MPQLYELDTSGERTLVNVRCMPLGDCAELLSTITRLIDSQVRTHVDAAYEGKELKVASDSTTSGPAYEPQERIQLPICNMADSMYGASGGEVMSNHSGQACGATVCELKPDKVCTYCGQKNCPYRPLLLPGASAESAKCERERAWKRGAYIRDVQLALAEVNEEILRDKRLFVGPRCQHGVRDAQFSDLVSSHERLKDEWAAVNQGRPITCDVDPTRPTPDEDPVFLSGNDRRIPGIAGCHLNSSRTALVLAFAHSGVCEVFARADERWLKDSLRMDDVVRRTAKDAGRKCFAPGTKIAGPGWLDEGAGPTATDTVRLKQVIECANREYASRIEGAFREAYARLESPSGSDSPSEAEREPSPLALCPKESPDCRKCAGDVLYCGTGTVFSSAQLRALGGVVLDLRVARSNIERAWTHISDAPFYDAVLGSRLRRSGGYGELGLNACHLPGGEGGRAPAGGSTVGPVPSGSPSPSPSPGVSASPSPDAPEALPSKGPSGVSEISFPGPRPQQWPTPERVPAARVPSGDNMP